MLLDHLEPENALRVLQCEGREGVISTGHGEGSNVAGLGGESEAICVFHEPLSARGWKGC
jgi:hypothetical protein